MELFRWHKEGAFFCWVFDVRVNEEGVNFTVDVFNHNLEAVEAAGFRSCYFGGKVGAEVLVDNAIGGKKNSRCRR